LKPLCPNQPLTSRPVFISCAVPPEQLFLPLLSAALGRGVDPNLGRAEKLPAEQLKRHRAATADSSSSGSEGRGEAAAAAGGPRGRDWGAVERRGGSQRGDPAAEGGGMSAYAEQALVAEEVLMYHRAASRLAEMTRVGW
jgi:hypothetical protein